MSRMRKKGQCFEQIQEIFRIHNESLMELLNNESDPKKREIIESCLKENYDFLAEVNNDYRLHPDMICRKPISKFLITVRENSSNELKKMQNMCSNNPADKFVKKL